MWADYKMKVKGFWKLHWKSNLERHSSQMLWTFGHLARIPWMIVIPFSFPLWTLEFQRIQSLWEKLECPFESIVSIKSGVLPINPLVTFCNSIWRMRVRKGIHEMKADESTWKTCLSLVSLIFLAQVHSKRLLSFPPLCEHCLIVSVHRKMTSLQIRLLSLSSLEP